MEIDSWNKKQKNFEKIQKPILLIKYSRMMKGVDINNNMICSYYKFPNEYKKW